MMELAMAEAYRARPKQNSSQTKANVSPLLVQRGSSLSGKLSPSISMKSFSPFKRKKRQNSLKSTESTLSSQTDSKQETLLDFYDEEEEEKIERPPPTPITLPELPSNGPLPQEETDDFDSALENAVNDLQQDFTSGARQLADASLKHLAHVTDIAACIATSWSEFWALMVHAAKHLSCARPSMSAAITACLLRALEQIARLWNEEQAKGSQSTAELARIAGGTLEKMLVERQRLSAQLGAIFTQWLRQHCSERIHTRNTVRILTLSNSSTIRSAILHALSSLPDILFHITVLESRPRCEGADMVTQIYSSACDKDRINFHVVPDCAVGTASRDIDIVLLGADRISSNGDVSNKIGSLAAALCTKQLNKNVAVVALSDADKIAPPGQDIETMERHPASELTSAWSPVARNTLEGNASVEIFGEWFEWVPAVHIDAYITELAVLGTKDVEKLAKEIGELEQYIFQ